MLQQRRSLSNSGKKPDSMQVGEGRILNFLEKKFRLSKSHFTTTAYKVALNRFEEFLKTKYDSDVDWLIPEIKEKGLDPLDVLDEYYTYLSQYLKGNGDGLRSATVVNCHNCKGVPEFRRLQVYKRTCSKNSGFQKSQKSVKKD